MPVGHPIPGLARFEASELQVLITGFGPFLDHARNPSWEVAQSFAEALSDSFSVSCEQLPVTYADAARFAERMAVEQGQRLVVHFGLAAERTEISLERYAHNCRGPTPDESEPTRYDWPDVVVPDGPTALETRLDVRELAAKLDQTSHHGARVSRDVGEYVCNAIYYHSLRAVSFAKQADRPAEALFVHVPPLDSTDAESVGTRFGQIFRDHLMGLVDGP
jgi:pyroglutamyl-peptidase